MTRFERISAAAALLASAAMAATPATAAELPVRSAPIAVPTELAIAGWNADEVNAERHRRYRYRHHRYRNRTSAGDVIGGLLILGGIAAVADAVSKNNDRRYRDRDYRYRDYRYRDYRDRDYDYRGDRRDSNYGGSRGIDNAVDICVQQIERDVRVESVDNVDRTAAGWRVTGSLYNGERFTCQLGRDGRIDDIDYLGRGSRGNVQYRDGQDFSASYSAPVENRQYSDDRYATAWAGANAQVTQAEPRVAYPGGPIDQDYPEDDRYNTGETPDF